MQQSKWADYRAGFGDPPMIPSLAEIKTHDTQVESDPSAPARDSYLGSESLRGETTVVRLTEAEDISSAKGLTHCPKAGQGPRCRSDASLVLYTVPGVVHSN